jgi:hypothetical protein
MSKSPCKTDPRLYCQVVRCPTQHMTKDGKSVLVPACSLVYFEKDTGYIQPSCTMV